MYDERFLRRAIDLASANIGNGGGPFGAVVVRDGEVIAESGNRVTADHDPTAHAEVMAIRLAARKLNDFSLRGCDIYASCEPCPMCLAAIYWARIDNVYYAASSSSAAQAGFDDSVIYRQIRLPKQERTVPMRQYLQREGELPFLKWISTDSKTEY